ncbi:AAA family ATPase [Sedimentibacter saalensis]|jgi:septum formation inhibitor-activating ATPase MinD|uniref:Septum formation inhibitor-activating ATPase MinD n=1 Tax=Sedimentibacter saalensis TaxID=130788 RepID=A0A562J9L2_9FIRM|nr:AAA family ATPase [Sedimentibacter saalensis]TWH79869.1 septum formation inhibitor-activating ATPase MinD [Sedimentibacter saalensis]
MGRVVLVGSQKSEIGSTVLSIKMGIELSQDKKKVLLADLSGGKKKMSEYLKVNEDIIYDIKDVLDDTCSLEQSVIEVVENLNLAPYPRIHGKLDHIKKEKLSKIINAAKTSYDYVIVDIGKFSSSFIDFDIADMAVDINNNDFSCVREINNDKIIAEMSGLKEFTAVINKFNKKNAVRGTMMKIKDIQKMTMITPIVIEENTKFLDMDSYFLFGSEDNSFQRAAKNIVSKIK